MAMKICILSTKFPPHNIGGEELYAKSLYDSLSKKHTVFNVNNAYGKTYDDEKIINLSCRTSTLFSALNLPNPTVYLKLRRAFKKLKPDVIHINNTHTTLSTEPFFASSRFPTVVEIHDWALLCVAGNNIRDNEPCNRFDQCWKCVHDYYLQRLSYRTQSPFRVIVKFLWKHTNISLRNKALDLVRKRLAKMSLSRVDRIICPSKTVMNACQAFGISDDKLVYLPYGVDLSQYEVTPVPESPAVGFVGRLHHTKGCHILVQAFKTVVAEIPEAQLHIVGEGEERDALERMVRDLRLEQNVCFLGKMVREEVVAFCRKIQFLVIPSIWAETPALITYDAMASMRTVIASDIGDFPELVANNKNGLLVEPHNPEKLSERIIYLLRNPSITKELAVNALQTIKGYDIRPRNDKLVEVYAGLKGVDISA